MRVNNRPWPVPTEPWIMVQTWENLMFTHWQIPEEILRRFIPDELHIDTFNGSGWIAVTPFELSSLRWRLLPPVPSAAGFPEINVRTYVRAGDKPGVFFFSLDAGSRLAVEGARTGFGLPYFFCDARVDRVQEGIHYRSTRRDRRGKPATFHSQYRPTGDIFNAEPGTLEYFLTERYCLYTMRRPSRLWRAEIDHVPWPLQTAEAEIWANTMVDAGGVQLPDRDPLLHFSRYLDVKVWRPMQVPEEELATSKPGR